MDLLNPAATRVYLGMVYEEYARRFPQHLGTTLKLTVADHEGAYGAVRKLDALRLPGGTGGEEDQGRVLGAHYG